MNRNHPVIVVLTEEYEGFRYFEKSYHFWHVRSPPLWAQSAPESEKEEALFGLSPDLRRLVLLRWFQFELNEDVSSLLGMTSELVVECATRNETDIEEFALAALLRDNNVGGTVPEYLLEDNDYLTRKPLPSSEDFGMIYSVAPAVVRHNPSVLEKILEKGYVVGSININLPYPGCWFNAAHMISGEDVLSLEVAEGDPLPGVSRSARSSAESQLPVDGRSPPLPGEDGEREEAQHLTLGEESLRIAKIDAHLRDLWGDADGLFAPPF